MDTARVTAHRRMLWCALVFLVGALCVFGDASAQTYPCTGGAQCTRQEAYASCQQEMADVKAWAPTIGWTVVNDVCHHSVGSGGLHGAYQPQGQYRNGQGTIVDSFYGSTHSHQGCPPDAPWDEETKVCVEPPECSFDDPALGPSLFNSDTPGAFNVCHDGCAYVDMDDTTDCAKIDGTFWCSSEGWEPLGLTCSAGTPSTGAEAPTDSDGDGISDGNDSNPENPGETGDNEGEGDGDDECGAIGQPLCNNNGGTSGAGNTSTGGGDCNTPPNSNGDAILAQIAYQTWATRCAQGNGQGNDVKGAASFDCTKAPTCSLGDAIGCAILRQSWFNHCDALNGADSEAVGDFSHLGQIDGLENATTDVFPDDEPTDEEIDMDGFGPRGSCPIYLNFSAMGRTYTIDHPQLCTVLDALATIVTMLGLLHAGWILYSGYRKG